MCIPVSANRKVRGPHTREWETPVTLSDGSKVMIVGYQMPGGRIAARYVTTGRDLEVANAGDYVYPCDVRFNAQTNLLFVKASGLAGGISHETWLFEYDLLHQQLIERRRVADSALPRECPESPLIAHWLTNRWRNINCTHWLVIRRFNRRMYCISQ